MTISAFVNEHIRDGLPVGGRGARRRYREEKRVQAENRQAAFDAEVAQVARDQNCLPETARGALRSRKRFEHRTGRLTPISLARIEAEASCRICGCTEDRACGGGCWWVPDPQMLGDLCSACLPEVAA